MDELIGVLIFTLLGWAVIYTCGSVAAGSMEIHEWSEGLRYFSALTMLCWFGGMFAWAAMA